MAKVFNYKPDGPVLEAFFWDNSPVTKVAIQAQVTHSFDGIGFAPRTVEATPDVVVEPADNA